MLIVCLFSHMTSITGILVNDFCHSGANERQWPGRLSCTGCPNNFWAGDRPSFLHGVFLYCSKDRESFSQLTDLPCHAADTTFFIDLSIALWVMG